MVIYRFFCATTIPTSTLLFYYFFNSGKLTKIRGFIFFPNHMKLFTKSRRLCIMKLSDINESIAMKIILLLFSLTFLSVSVSDAQLRKDLSGNSEYSGVVTHTQQPSSNNWMNQLNMTMNHSYSMTFSSFGGQMQNLNAYTNSMLFDISEKLDAQVDISFLHSPFGNSFMANESLGSKIIVDRARLDYQISDNANISFEFSQRPYGYSPFNNHGYGYGFNRGYYSPMGRHHSR